MNVYLSGANLPGAFMSYAKLGDADLSGVTGADFTGALNAPD